MTTTMDSSVPVGRLTVIAVPLGAAALLAPGVFFGLGLVHDHDMLRQSALTFGVAALGGLLASLATRRGTTRSRAIAALAVAVAAFAATAFGLAHALLRLDHTPRNHAGELRNEQAWVLWELSDRLAKFTFTHLVGPEVAGTEAGLPALRVLLLKYQALLDHRQATLEAYEHGLNAWSHPTLDAGVRDLYGPLAERQLRLAATVSAVVDWYDAHRDPGSGEAEEERVREMAHDAELARLRADVAGAEIQVKAAFRHVREQAPRLRGSVKREWRIGIEERERARVRETGRP